MSFPLESVALERIETLLTLGTANGKKNEINKHSINKCHIDLRSFLKIT